MRGLQTSPRGGLVVIMAAGLVAISACGGGNTDPAAVPPNPAAAESAATVEPAGPLKNEIPPGEIEKVMAAHYRGLGHMEQYKYLKADSTIFREVRRRAPGWIPGSINLAIALLNDSGA